MITITLPNLGSVWSLWLILQGLDHALQREVSLSDLLIFRLTYELHLIITWIIFLLDVLTKKHYVWHNPSSIEELMSSSKSTFITPGLTYKKFLSNLSNRIKSRRNNFTYDSIRTKYRIKKPKNRYDSQDPTKVSINTCLQLPRFFTIFFYGGINSSWHYRFKKVLLLLSLLFDGDSKEDYNRYQADWSSFVKKNLVYRSMVEKNTGLTLCKDLLYTICGYSCSNLF